MAITYDVKFGRGESGGYAKGSRKDSMRQTWQQTWSVEVTDPADPSFNPAYISTFEMFLGATELPIVGRTVGYDPGTFTGVPLVFPFLICREKNATRNQSNPGLWLVTARFDSGDRATGTTDAGKPQGGELAPISPPENIAAYPAQTEAATGQVQRQMWVDADGFFCVLPTGNQFAEPLYEIRGTEIARVSQYEAAADSATLASRKMAVNSDSYRGDPAGTWLIKDVETTGVDLPTTGANVSGFEIDYTLERSPFAEGWLDHRALLDTHYLATASDIDTRRPFYDERLESRLLGFIAEDGTALPKTANEPIYRDFQKYNPISFSFLKA